MITGEGRGDGQEDKKRFLLRAGRFRELQFDGMIKGLLGPLMGDVLRNI